eukprot:1616829-Prymnesium_polylepis.1
MDHAALGKGDAAFLLAELRLLRREKATRSAFEREAGAITIQRVLRGRHGRSAGTATRAARHERAAVRLQRWWHSASLRANWLEAVRNLREYHQLIRDIKRARSAARLQRWWRAYSLRRRWLEAVTNVR